MPPEGEDEPTCIEEKERLLQRITNLELPPNFLDQLVDLLGGEAAVAEMTGRRGRILRKEGRGVYTLRAKPESSEMDSLNIKVRPFEALPACYANHVGLS